MEYSLALAQAITTKNIKANYATLERLVLQAKANGCQALCFSEAFLTGYSLAGVAEQSLTLASPYLERVAGLALLHGVDILVGFQERRGQAYYLTQGIFLADGRREFYRKTHLGQREASFFTAGDKLPVFSLSCGLKIGISLCVESHFPELLQSLALRGAELVFAPHAVPVKAGPRREIWNKYIPARSYDNRLYMACCNLWDDNNFGGGCLVTGPTGEEVCSNFIAGESLVSFVVDTALIAYYRGNNSMRNRYYPLWRRRELYE